MPSRPSASTLLRAGMAALVVIVVQLWALFLAVDFSRGVVAAELPDRLAAAAPLLLAIAFVTLMALVPVLLVASLLAWVLGPFIRGGPLAALGLGVALGMLAAVVWIRLRLGSLVPGGFAAFVWLGASAGAVYAWVIWRARPRVAAPAAPPSVERG